MRLKLFLGFERSKTRGRSKMPKCSCENNLFYHSCIHSISNSQKHLRSGLSKGGLNSESFLYWFKSPEHYLPTLKREDAQESDLALLFGYLSQREKLSEIKPSFKSIVWHVLSWTSLSLASEFNGAAVSCLKEQLLRFVKTLTVGARRLLQSKAKKFSPRSSHQQLVS